MMNAKRALAFLSSERYDENSSPPFLLKIRSSKIFILFSICVAIFTDIYLYGMVVPVLPFTIVERAGVDPAQLQKWVSIMVAIYGGALAVASPIIGFFADKSTSRKAPLLVGLLCLAASTLMLCLARSIALVVVGRLLQGFSASVVWTVGLALIVDTVGEDEVGEMLGYMSISMTLGFLLGPLLGGIVFERVGYYPVFYISFGLIALDIILRLLLIERKVALQWDTKPSTQDTGTPHKNTKSDENLTSGDETTNQVPATSKPSRLPPVITILRSKRLLAALWGCVVQGTLITAFDGVLPIFVHRTFGWGATAAGLSFLPLVIPNFTAPIVGWISDHYGPRWPVVIGFLIGVPCWVLLRLVTHNSMGQKVLFFALLTFIGLTLTLVLAPLVAEISYIVQAKETQHPGRFGPKGVYAQAYGLFIFCFATGNLIGPLWAGNVDDHADWGTMAWSLGIFSFAGAVPSLIWTGGLITERKAKKPEEQTAEEVQSTPEPKQEDEKV